MQINNPTETPKAPEKVFQHYKSSKASTRLITKTGGKINFAGYEFITDNESFIAYLDAEIANGMRSITKGEALTSDQIDPMAAYRRKVIKEYEEEKELERVMEAKGISKDMGTSDQTRKTRINPMASRSVASGASNS